MSNLLQTIETAITLYGANPQEVREQARTKLESYRHEKWRLSLSAQVDQKSQKEQKELLALALAVKHLATYPHEVADCLSKLLYHRYLAPHALDKTALMARYYLEERTYYRRKKEALSLLGLILLLAEQS